MSGLVATVGLWSNDKSISLTKYTSHGHVPNPIARHFEAPHPVQSPLSDHLPLPVPSPGRPQFVTMPHPSYWTLSGEAGCRCWRQ